MKRKRLAVLICTVMLLAGVAATMAYFTDAEQVKNTFTVGNIEITLDEAKVTLEGEEIEGENRVQENEYHLLPGHSYVKDPTIHVAANSEDCYLFVAVKNDLADIECKDADYWKIENQMIGMNGWIKLDNVTKDGAQVYCRKDIIVKQDSTHDVAVFHNFKIDGAVDNTTLAEYATKTNGTLIKVTAYAVQADGFHTGDDSIVLKEEALKAWNATFAENK